MHSSKQQGTREHPRNHICLSKFVGLVTFIVIPLAGCSVEKVDTATAPGQLPDLNGVWQAMGSAHWDLEGHAASKTPATDVYGAFGAIPPGDSVVVGDTIPYQDWALKQRNENRDVWTRRDRGAGCFIPGIPRLTYMPLPFHIVQSDTKIFIAYAWGANSRLIHLDRPGSEAALPSWMGYSLGRFEGDTLVVDVTDQMPESWFDAGGNFHSDKLKVTERYTVVGPNHLEYEATIDDPDVFTQPWTIKMPLYRRMEENARILEFKCVEFAEDLIYGHLRRGVRKEPAVDYIQ